MDGIQAYSPTSPPQPRPIVATVHGPATPHGGPPGAATKTAADYLGAVRRRIWLVLLVAIPIASAGTLLVLRMPAIYSVSAQITIEAPKSDPAISRLVGSGETIINDTGASEKYVPNTLALLNSRSFLQAVLADPALAVPDSALDAADPAAEMVGKIKTRPIPQSSTVQLTYEGKDPETIRRILAHVLRKFEDKANDKSRVASHEAAEKAEHTLKQLALDLENLDRSLARLIQENKDIAPNGQNLKLAEYELGKGNLIHQRNQLAALQQRIELDSIRPQQASPAALAAAQKIAQLEEQRARPAARLRKALNATRDKSDAAVVNARLELGEIDARLDQMRRAAATPADVAGDDGTQQLLDRANEDIAATQGHLGQLMEDVRDGMGVYTQYQTMMSDRADKAKAIASMREKLAAYRIVIEAQKKPVDIIDEPVTPLLPIRPNRTLYIGACLMFGFGAGLALVCLLEHVDHSVKVPEHLTAGLALPLFGVVPRMIRSAANHRGGHLWTSGTPDSIEADAYRNLRASLLGATDGRGPIVTLLITSAKAGEGKSTTALNLAATCARAGERTLLMDVDLRRPSLNGVFPGQDHDHGLVDVLRGDLPWQRVVVPTDLPNLDFLPTGDTRDVPIEVLGSLELRQLLLSLAQNHYDRVILDGPAVLGLADCRMLGRIVDAAVMVVRSGSQEIRSLQRAKAMLEQSQVAIAGLIFNGLRDDLENWSSYGPNPFVDPAPQLANGRPARAAAGVLAAADA